MVILMNKFYSNKFKNVYLTKYNLNSLSGKLKWKISCPEDDTYCGNWCSLILVLNSALLLLF